MNTDRLTKGFFTGINYWGSESAINMWSNFNADSIEKDLQLLRSAGITHLRIFPLWPVFQPLNALYGNSNVYEYTFGEDPLPDTPAGRAGVSEEACQKFKKFCDLAQQYDMQLVVALITGHMSGRTYNPPAFDGKALLSDPTVIKWQRRFVKYFVTRFKDEPAIAGWDLGNEPIHMPGLAGLHQDAFYVWCSIIADAVKACDPVHPVISGLDHSSVEKGYSNLKTIGEICDIHTTHPYNIFCTQTDPLNTMKPILDLTFKCKLGEDISGIPTFVQEYGSIGYMNCSRKTEAEFYRATLLACLSHGCHGAMWWCAFDQGHLGYAPYRWNTIGSDYGFFDKDLAEKPLAEENRKFKQLLAKLPGGTLPKHAVNATVLVPRDDGGANLNLLRATYLLAKQANLDVSFSYVLDPIPDSPLYIIPSIKTSRSIPKNRLDSLLQKVRDGAVLYLCADTGLIRQLPAMTGVEIAYREDVSTEKKLILQDNSLPIQTKYFYKIENSKAQVLARDNTGEAAFFKYPYGKGFVYFLTLPLEAHLAEKHGVFFKEAQPPYHLIYRELAKTAKITRVCDSDNPYVRLTEHPLADGSLYVVAINYSNRQERAALTIAEGYAVSVVHGKMESNTTLFLEANNGIILKLEKN